MRKTFFYYFTLTLTFCNYFSALSQNNKNGTPEIEKTITTQSRKIGSDISVTFSSERKINNEISIFNGNYYLKTKPKSEIKMNFSFKENGTQILDSLGSELFSKLIDLRNVKKIQIDSLDYKVINEEFRFKFTVLLHRKNDTEVKIWDKYFMLYSSGFTNSEPTLIVDKVERTSVKYNAIEH